MPRRPRVEPARVENISGRVIHAMTAEWIAARAARRLTDTPNVCIYLCLCMCVCVCVCVANLGQVAVTLEIIWSSIGLGLIKVGICLDRFIIGHRD